MSKIITLEDLLELYRTFSPTFGEKEMSNLVQSKLKKLGINDFKIDNYHQIYRIIPNTPLVFAHMDQVYAKPAKKITINNSEIRGDGTLGADDKNGIWICLSILEEHPDISFIFSTEEETCNGNIKHICQTEYLEDLLYGLLFDRRNGTNIIGTLNDYCTEEFEKELEIIGGPKGYKSVTGAFSDADEVSNYISCVNLSCGYYNPHTTTDYTNITQLKTARKFGLEIIENITDQYEKPVYSRKWNYGYNTFPKLGKSEYVKTWFNSDLEKQETEDYYDYYECPQCGNLYEVWEIDEDTCPDCKVKLTESKENDVTFCCYCGISLDSDNWERVGNDFLCKKCAEEFDYSDISVH